MLFVQLKRNNLQRKGGREGGRKSQLVPSPSSLCSKVSFAGRSFFIPGSHYSGTTMAKMERLIPSNDAEEAE